MSADPQTIGADAFIDLVMPVVRQCSQKMDGQDVARVYSGILGALYGSLTADFGADMAPKLLSMFTKKLLEMEPLERSH